MKPLFVLSAGLLLGMAAPSHAVTVADFPGLDKLAEEADVIAIVRPEGRGNQIMMDGWSQQNCFVYQTLKGEFQKNDFNAPERLQLSLNIFATPRPNFGESFAPMSTHLVFLRRSIPNRGSNYSIIVRRGASLPLSPFGNEKKPEGATLKLQIQTLIRHYQTYRDAELKREDALLQRALSE